MARRGRRGEGSAFWSKADRYWIARYPHGPDGKPLRAKRRTKDEAEAILEGWRTRYGGRPVTGATLDAWWAEWFPGHADSIRASTATSYRGHYAKHIGPLLGGMPLEQLEGSDVRRLIAAVRGKRKGKRPKDGPDERPTLSAGTVHLVVRTLSVALNAAVAEGRIPRNVTIGVRLPRVDREPVKAMTDADRDAILAAVKGTWVERPVRVLLGSGLRAGELLGLNQGQLVLDEQYVRVLRSKTSARAVPITQDAAEALRDALRAAPRVGNAEPVFYGPRSGARLRVDTLNHTFQRALAAAGLPRMHVHELRHGVATMMLTGGAPMRAIADQLGHRNPSMTARVYTHVVPELQRRAVASLERSQTR